MRKKRVPRVRTRGADIVDGMSASGHDKVKLAIGQRGNWDTSMSESANLRASSRNMVWSWR